MNSKKKITVKNINVYLGNWLIGKFNDGVFTTTRRDKHIFRIWNGYGLNAQILNLKGLKEIRILNLDMKKSEYRITLNELNKYEKDFNFYVEYYGEKQIVIPFAWFRTINKKAKSPAEFIRMINLKGSLYVSWNRKLKKQVSGFVFPFSKQSEERCQQ